MQVVIWGNYHSYHHYCQPPIIRLLSPFDKKSFQKKEAAMTKLVILNPNERRRYDSPPVFNTDERSLYFSMGNEEMELIQSLRTTSNKIGFAIQLAYFKANGKFFAVDQFRQQDIFYAAKTIGINDQQ